MADNALPQLVVAPLEQARAAVVPWRFGDRRFLTVVVKATFAFAPEGPMNPLPAQPIVGPEVHHGNSPARSLRLSSDLAPYLSRADVLFTGHAHAPPGRRVEAMTVRLAVVQDGEEVIDKTLLVRGEGGRPFERMPLVYERAFGGVGWQDNPFGVGTASGDAPASIVHPDDPRRTVGFGPIASTWPARKRLLRIPARAALAPAPELPAEFDLAFYQAAPADQQIGYLRGDEWIVLEGMHPTLPGIRTRLPSARAVAWIYGRTASTAPEPITLVADTLRIEGDDQRASLVWRGNVELSANASLGAMRIFAGVELPRRPLVWPSQEAAPPEAARGMASPAAAFKPAEKTIDLGAQAEGDLAGTLALAPESERPARAPLPFAPSKSIAIAPAPPEEPADPPLAGTLALDDAGAKNAERAPVMPFVPGGAPRATPPPRPAAPPAGAPWSAEPAPPVPPVHDEEPTRTLPTAALLGDKPAAPPSVPPPPPPVRPAARPVRPSAPPPPPAARAPVQPSIAENPAPFAHAIGAARSTDAIRIVTREPLAGFSMVWQVKPPASSLVVVWKATFDLVPDGPATLRGEPEVLTGDLHRDDDPGKSLVYPSDFAVFKPRADVTLKGHAFAPGGRGKAAEVRFRFGRRQAGFERRIAVFGERQWEKALVKLAPTDPRSFDRIPLVWEAAYGGPGFEANPVGLGKNGDRLPLLEDPGRLVRAPDDAPQPACFAPVAPTWPERWSRLGTYDAHWKANRWPYFPEDFDWTYFQAAPRPQQLAWLEGDETFDIAGVHPAHPMISGKLPGMRVRAFAQRTATAGGALQEISLHLDTASFDTDEMKLVLVWRGLLPVADEDASDIAELFAMTERLSDKPMPIEAAHARYLADRALLEPAEEAPEPEPPANDVPAPPPEDENEKRVAAELAAHEEKLKADLAAMGVTVSSLDEPDEPPPLPRKGKRKRPPRPEALADALQKAGASAKEAAAAAMDMQPPELDDDEAPPAREVRAEVIEKLAAGASFEEADLAGADLSGLDFSGRSLAGANLKGARLAGAKLAMTNLSGAQMSAADLTDAVLEGAELEGADLFGATLEGASLKGASLSGADLGRVAAARANFSGARGEGTKFVEGRFADARFDEAELEGADFTGALIDGARFERAKLPQIRLYEAQGKGARFDFAEMDGARADGVKLVSSSLRGVRSPHSVWEGAVLDGSTFLGSVLTGASLEKASCVETNFGAVDLVAGRLARAKLARSVLLEANLMKASFERADLSGADLRASNLHGAELWKAKLRGAMLEGAITSKTKLEGDRA